MYAIINASAVIQETHHTILKQIIQILSIGRNVAFALREEVKLRTVLIIIATRAVIAGT